MSGLSGALEKADAVLLSTGSALPVLDVELMTPVARGRRSGAGSRESLVVVDVSVPRNVDPAVALIEGVELLDMDDLSELAEKALDGRRGEVAGAQAIVQQDDRARLYSVQQFCVSNVKGHYHRIHVSGNFLARHCYRAMGGAYRQHKSRQSMFLHCPAVCA